MVSGGMEIIGPGIDIFNRIVVVTQPQMELGPYKIAKLANEQFENLSLTKLPMLYDEVGKLEKISGAPRPMRLKGQDVGDYDLACLFTDGVEQEIWAAIEMAEDLPSSCVYYLGGGVDRKNLPPEIVDLRRQPASEPEPEEEERTKWDIEQRELQAAVVKNAVHWPMTVAAWTPQLPFR